ncbi:MAG TPA: Bax inhibitor-1/YccA family protein [Vicinamibacterales bacterium]|jgi:FtsH-binding integral membrane protein
MPQYEITPERAFTTPYALDERVTLFLRSVYGWMFAGLAITAVVAYAVAQSPSLVIAISRNPLAYWGLMIAQLGIVLVLSVRVERMAASTAGMLFIAYSALTGVTFSFILLAYTGASIATTFLVCSGMFGSLALYGTTTTKSLAGWGQFLFMGLVGVVLASFVGIFWQNDMFQFVLGFIGVIVFTGLAAYDAQRLKQMALATPSGQIGSHAIVGALALYLDFINLFLMLLRFLGNRRN